MCPSCTASMVLRGDGKKVVAIKVEAKEHNCSLVSFHHSRRVTRRVPVRKRPRGGALTVVTNLVACNAYIAISQLGSGTLIGRDVFQGSERQRNRTVRLEGAEKRGHSSMIIRLPSLAVCYNDSSKYCNNYSAAHLLRLSSLIPSHPCTFLTVSLAAFTMHPTHAVPCPREQ